MYTRKTHLQSVEEEENDGCIIWGEDTRLCMFLKEIFPGGNEGYCWKKETADLEKERGHLIS